MPVPRRDRRLIWAGRLTAVVILAGLVGYLVHVGLDNADKTASSISAVIALAALLAPYLLPAPRPAPPLRGSAADVSGQAVTGSRVGGGVRQASGVIGSVRIGPDPTGRPPTVPPSPPPPAAPGTAPAATASQAVENSSVTGSVTQIRDVTGDVEIDR